MSKARPITGEEQAGDELMDACFDVMQKHCGECECFQCVRAARAMRVWAKERAKRKGKKQ